MPPSPGLIKAIAKETNLTQKQVASVLNSLQYCVIERFKEKDLDHVDLGIVDIRKVHRNSIPDYQWTTRTGKTYWRPPKPARVDVGLYMPPWIKEALVGKRPPPCRSQLIFDRSVLYGGNPDFPVPGSEDSPE